MNSKYVVLAVLTVAAALGLPVGASASANHYGLTISTDATSNVSFSNGVFTATADHANLNVNDLTNALADGSIKVTTDNGAGGDEKGDLHVEAAFSWTSANALTLDAFHTIFVDQPVSDSGTGGLSLTNNDGGTDGLLLFGASGNVTFHRLSTTLTINGSAYKLVKSLKVLAADIARNPKGHFALARKYDASQDGTYAGSPVSTFFEGAFTGLGHTISNLTVDHKRGAFDVGLFSGLADTGMIFNVRLKNERISVAEDQYVTAGGLVDTNGGLLFDDQTQGSISENHCCHRGGQSAGGLAGGNYGAIIYGTARVHITTHFSAGGLVASNAGSISLSNASGNVHARFEAAGLVADNIGTISQSYATGSVTGLYAGGLVAFSQDSSADISNSYATGAVTGGANSEVGGFIGENDSTIEDSYSTGAVSAGTGSFVGGFTGGWEGANGFQNCYWDTDTSGTDQGTGGGNPGGITGLTTKQLQSGLPSGFDPAIWKEKSGINNGLPYLIGNPPK